jgi:hypothetical protein
LKSVRFVSLNVCHDESCCWMLNRQVSARF